jgi:hypothetical protein
LLFSIFAKTLRRNAQHRWELFSFFGVEAKMELASIGLTCSLLEVYEAVDFSLV